MTVWVLIVEAILMAVKPRVTDWLFAILKSFLESLNPVIPMGAVPDAMKKWVKEFLLDAVANIKLPFVGRLLARVINALDGAILDAIWDYVADKLNPPTLPPGVVVTAGPPALMTAAAALPPIDVADIVAAG